MIIVSSRAGFWHDEEHGSWESQMEEHESNRRITLEEFTHHVIHQKVLVLVHGYNNDRNAVLRSYDKIQHNEKRWIDHYGLVIGYTWPGGNDFLDYIAARDRVSESARQFSALTELLLKKCNKVDVMSHSLGGRISLLAYDRLADSTDIPTDKTRQFLLAPAVDNNAIEHGEEFFRATTRCHECFVFYSIQDGTIGVGYSSQENGDIALGCNGPKNRRNVNENTYLIDCQNVVHRHGDYKNNVHIYTYIAKICREIPVPKYEKFHSDDFDDENRR